MAAYGTLSIAQTSTGGQAPSAAQAQPTQRTPPPPAATSSSSTESPQLKAKIAAIYAAAETAHTPAAEVQRQIDAAIAASPSGSSGSSGLSTVDYSA
jgi:hypothetical protein